MTLKLKKTKLFKALMAALCVLAVAFAVVLFMPRGAASAAESDTEDTYSVTWEYKTSAEGAWQSFVNGDTLFTYEEGEDYSALVRAKIDLGVGIDPDYFYYNSEGVHLSYSGTFDNGTVNALVNATEYTVTIEGELAVNVAAVDKTITIKIAPRVLDFNASDLIDYSGEEEPNRLWMFNNGSELGDLATYYDPAVPFNDEYGANVTTGMLYNAYARYTGKQQTVVLNNDYRINNVPLSNYSSAITITYDSNSSTGLANVVNKVSSSAIITLNANWVLDNGERIIILPKDWYIVTINNALRTLDGDENTTVEGWTYGATAPALSIRPEHGDNAVFTLRRDGATAALARFAVLYSGKGNNTVIEYYDVKSENGAYVIDTDKALGDDYCATQFADLDVGAYTLNVSVPAYTSTDDHEHWWADAEDEATSIVYYPLSRTYRFTIGRYEISADSVSMDKADNKDIMIKLLSDHVAYNAMDSNVPEIAVTFRGTPLEYDVDYLVSSTDVKVGKASFTFIGKGNFVGSVPFDDTYYIDQTANAWKEVPSIMYWAYGTYNKEMNLINATPAYLDNPNDISFKITIDQAGEIAAADKLESFILTDGIVSDDVAAALNSLSVGTYYLFAEVKESTNYKALAQRGIAFKVFKATNVWVTSPSVVVWTEGQFKSVSLPVAESLYGVANIVIKDDNGKDVYNNVTGVNKLSSAKAGTYTLTATVMGSNDYDGLKFSTVFNVHEKPGLPGWAVLVIVFGVLALLAIVVFILIKTNVLRILTEKIAVSIRTQAAVDATVASVRAAKKNDEYKRQLAEAKEKREAEALRQEKREARKAKAELEKAMPVEQKIAALEEKARKAEVRAEKARVRAELMQQRVERMKEATSEAPPAPAPTEQPATEPTAEAAATDNGTATEE